MTTAPLRAWRDSRGWTQADIAGRLGVTKGAISQHEIAGVGSLRLLSRYAEIYGVDVARLLAGPKIRK